jgi:benzoate-CoA ligase family protein
MPRRAAKSRPNAKSHAAKSPSRINIAEEFVCRPAREHPERLAILGEPAPATYGELARIVQRAGDALAASGCELRDRVLIVLPDSLEFIGAFFGAAKIGCIAVPVNPMARARDYGHYLADSGARIAIVHSAAMAEFAAAAQACGLRQLIVVGDAAKVSEPLERAKSKWAEWDEWLPPTAKSTPARATSALDPAFFLYTSGSGGRPKGVVHRHRDMLVCARAFAQGVLGLRPDDRTYSVSKLFFAYGLGNGMYFPFSVGAATILDPERPRPERVVELLARHRPSVFFGVPTFYAALLREADRGLPIDFSSVRLAVSAGETLPAEIFEQFQKRFGIEILDGIGSTEMLHIFLCGRPGEARAGSCGREVAGYAAKILDDSGERVADGEIGNLWVKGASAFAEYWKIPELTKRTKKGEWVLTGDKFTRDAQGYYHYCGRADDMMKVSGMWVSPGEVENALLGHPRVAEAAVVGRADEVGLVRPEAYIVLHDEFQAGASVHAASEIREWLHTKLAGHKCPAQIHLVAQLPKTPTGKIQRFLLRGRS